MAMTTCNIDFEPDIILCDGQEIEMTNNVLDLYPSAISIIDAGRPTEEIVKLSKRVNYLVCSKEFAETVSGIKINSNNDMIELYNFMRREFKNEIVITLEDKGCLYGLNNQVRMMPSLSVRAVDTTGAGDIFHGAFTYGIAQKLPLEKVLKISNIAGALSVTKVGSKYSIPTKEEIKKYEVDFK